MGEETWKSKKTKGTHHIKKSQCFCWRRFRKQFFWNSSLPNIPIPVQLLARSTTGSVHLGRKCFGLSLNLIKNLFHLQDIPTVIYRHRWIIRNQVPFNVTHQNVFMFQPLLLFRLFSSSRRNLCYNQFVLNGKIFSNIFMSQKW